MKPNSRNGIGENTFGKANGNMFRESLARGKDKTLVKRAQYTSMDPGSRPRRSRRRYRDMFARAMPIIFVSRHSSVNVCSY